VLVLTKRERILDNKLSYLAIYGPGIFFLGLLWLTWEIYSGMQQVPWGFASIQERGFLAAVAYVEVALILGSYYCFQAYRGFTGLERKQVGLIGAAALVPIVGGTLTNVMFPLMDIRVVGLATMLLLPTVIIFVIAIVKYKLLILPPISRFFIPTPEAYLSTKPKYKLEEGRGYLIKEEKPSRGLTIFMDQTKHGVPGLWITSRHPKELEKYGLRRTPVLSLTSERIRGEVTLPPGKLDRAKALVSNYLLRTRGRSVVFVDCFRELVVVNGFKRTLDFIQGLGKICSENASNLIVRVDPAAFTKRQLAEIERALREREGEEVEEAG
jgi:hypothetical protein